MKIETDMKKFFVQIIILSIFFAGCLNLCAAQGNPGTIVITSGPTVRIPNLGLPTVLTLTGPASGPGNRIKWKNEAGLVIGEGTTVSIYLGGTYSAWIVETVSRPNEPNIESWFFIASLEVEALAHNIVVSGANPLNEIMGTTLCIQSNAFSEYTARMTWYKGLWDLTAEDGGTATCRSIISPAQYWATVTYSYGSQSVTVPVTAVTVFASANSPELLEPIHAYNPVRPPTLVVTNANKFTRYKIIHDHVQIADQTSPFFEVPKPGNYMVAGLTSSPPGIAYTYEFFIQKGDIPVPVVSATNNGILLYEAPHVQLSTMDGYHSYTWYKNGQVLSGVTTNTVTLSNVKDVGTYTVKGCATYPDGSSQCKTSLPKEVTGEIFHVNFVRKKVSQIENVSSYEQLDLLPTTQVNVSTEYADGFARPIQSVQRAASPLGKDIVIEKKYDAFGRETKQILPFIRQTSDGFYSYVFKSLKPVNDFYQKDGDDIANTGFPFAETLFEASPMNRVLKQGAPGEEWQLSTTHAKTFVYASNNAFDRVRVWEPSMNGLSAYSFYPDGSLFLVESTDENGKRYREFKDKTDHIILTEKIIEGGVKLRTYFVFDDIGRLTHVIPPNATASLPEANSQFTLTVDVLAKECYRYQYDERNRLIVRHIPGAGADYTVYDPWNRVVLTQHANQRVKNKWSFNKYDALNRIVMTGEIVLSGDYITAAQVVIDFYASIFTTPTLRYEESGSEMHGYTNRSYPVLANQFQVYTATYYDSYGFLSQFGTAYQFSPETSLGLSARSTFTNGLMTGTKTAILGSPSHAYLKTVSYYDNKHRLVQVVTDNHLGGIDRVSNALDFTGKVIKTRSIHNGLQVVTIDQEFTYDPQGRKLRAYHKVNSGPKILLCDYHYNELGQVVEKNIHSADGNTFLQSLDYAYNIRGWLSQVNYPSEPDDHVSHQDQYGFSLLYTSGNGITGFQPSFNGNIAAYSDMRPGGDAGVISSTYSYRYDARNQIIQANYFQQNRNGAFDLPEITYDQNGNIKTLKRKGVTSEPSGLIDDLIYRYNGNQLTEVSDAKDKTKGFIDRP